MDAGIYLFAYCSGIDRLLLHSTDLAADHQLTLRPSAGNKSDVKYRR